MIVAHPLARGTRRSAAATRAGGSSAVPSAPVCDVRVVLGELVTDAEIRADLAGDPAHWLLEFDPEITTSRAGRAEIEMTLPGSDLWSATLTTMAVLRRSGYDLHSLHVESRAAGEDRPEA